MKTIDDMALEVAEVTLQLMEDTADWVLADHSTSGRSSFRAQPGCVEENLPAWCCQTLLHHSCAREAELRTLRPQPQSSCRSNRRDDRRQYPCCRAPECGRQK